MKRLSNKEQAFIYYKARGYNNCDSVLKAGYKAKSRKIASSYAIKLLSKVEITQAIEEEKTNIFDTSVITDEFILGSALDLYRSTRDERIKKDIINFLAECKGLKRQVIESKQDITVKETQQKQEVLDYINNRVKNVN